MYRDTEGTVVKVSITYKDIAGLRECAEKLPEYHAARVFVEACCDDLEAHRDVALKRAEENGEDTRFEYGACVHVFCPAVLRGYFGTEQSVFKDLDCEIDEQVLYGLRKS